MTKTKIPRYHGAHRPERASLDFTHLYKLVTGRRFSRTEDRAAIADTDILPTIGELPEPLPPLVTRIRELRDVGGVIVTTDPHFIPQVCEWCCRGRITSVRVTGRPARLDLHRPLDQAETCHICAPVAIDQALIEQGESDLDIRVEVAE